MLEISLSRLFLHGMSNNRQSLANQFNKRAMMALNHSPESFSPTNKFYIFVPLVSNCDPQGGASFDPKGHNMIHEPTT